MKNLRKALALFTALSTVAMSTSAFASVTATGTFGDSNVTADYSDINNLNVGATVAMAGATSGSQASFVIMDKDADTSNVAAADIIYLDQKELTSSSNSFTGVINLARITGATDSIPAGSYPIKLGYYDENGDFGIAEATMVVTEDVVAPVVTGVTITSAATVVAGQTLSLTATVEGTNLTNQAVNWSVENAGTTGATITDGSTLNVSATGTVKVRATSQQDTTKYAEADITVTAPAVTGVTITSVQDGVVDTAYTLAASVLPTLADQTITWTVVGGTAQANATITGSSLMVTAPGTVTVRATASNSKYDEATITFANPAPSNVAVAITTDATEAYALSDEVELAATVSGNYLTAETVTWSIKTGENEANATIEGGVLTAANAGTVTVVATADTDGKTTAEKTFTFASSGVTVKFVFGDLNGGVYTGSQTVRDGSVVTAGDALDLLKFVGGGSAAAGGAFEINDIVTDTNSVKFVFGDLNGGVYTGSQTSKDGSVVTAGDALDLLKFVGGGSAAAGGAYDIGDIVSVIVND